MLSQIIRTKPDAGTANSTLSIAELKRKQLTTHSVSGIMQAWRLKPHNAQLSASREKPKAKELNRTGPLAVSFSA